MSSFTRFVGSFLLLSNLATSSVVVRKTYRGPTGYEVDFSYTNVSVSSVLIGGKLKPFTDKYHTTTQYSEAYTPYEYKPGDFPVQIDILGDYGPGGNWSGFPMTSHGNGTFSLTLPLPSGTYTYAFLLDCEYGPNCTTANGKYIVDPDNKPFETAGNTVLYSVVQVPYDSIFQYTDELDLNFDFALPVAEKYRGKIIAETYPSPESIVPKTDIHDFAIYLPNGYNYTDNHRYPILYLSHGGGENAGAWPNNAKMGNIMDRLIIEGYIEPTVVVMPTFYYLVNGSTPGSPSSATPSFITIREKYMQYLFPYIEANYPVGGDPSRRAFAGLSLGGALTYEMYINATDYFGYFNIMSGVLLPNAPTSLYINASMVEANPSLASRGILVGFGLYDIAFDDCRKLQAAFDEIGIGYISRVVPYGSHFFNTWQDILWTFGRFGLWKERPFNRNTTRE
ncbi:hypothetical protein ACMFMG_011269 [Clarireedia jacksonii]